MKDYFEGAINQLIVRCEHLVGMIPGGLPPEFAVLDVIVRNELSEISKKLRQLLESDIWQKPENQHIKMRRFKEAVCDIDILETTCIAALERQHDNDLFLNKMMQAIRKEINYPLPPPVITSLARPKTYFETLTKYRLMLVPLSESRFLLHLPDIYHEIAHPLLEEPNDPKLKFYQQSVNRVIEKVTEYISDEREKSRRRNEPQAFTMYLDVWLVSWIGGWAKEFFCDLFAVYVLGPAFAWSHLHLAATRGRGVFQVPLFGKGGTHPPDAARMETILNGLTLIGFENEAAQIDRKWKTFLSTSNAEITPEYQRCFPRPLLKTVAEIAFEAAKSLNCRIVTPETTGDMHDIFNQSWKEFWINPSGYVQWETQTIADLRKQILV